MGARALSLSLVLTQCFAIFYSLSLSLARSLFLALAHCSSGGGGTTGTQSTFVCAKVSSATKGSKMK
jgi:hypothetical protein